MNPMEQLEARDDMNRLCPRFKNAIEHYEKIRLAWVYRVNMSEQAQIVSAHLQDNDAKDKMLNIEIKEVEDLMAAAYDLEYARRKLNDAQTTVDWIRSLEKELIGFRVEMNRLNNLYNKSA